MKTVLVVCGSGIATSTAVVVDLRNKLEERGIEIKTKQCDVFSIRNHLDGVSAIAYTCALKEDYGVPAVNAVALLTGIGADQVIDKLADILQD